MGEESNANEAGNLVLGDVALFRHHRSRSATTIPPADQERGGGTTRQRGNQGRGSAGLDRSSGGVGSGWARPPLPPPGDPKPLIFYPWRPTILAMSHNVPGLPNLAVPEGAGSVLARQDRLASDPSPASPPAIRSKDRDRVPGWAKGAKRPKPAARCYMKWHPPPSPPARAWPETSALGMGTGRGATRGGGAAPSTLSPSHIPGGWGAEGGTMLTRSRRGRDGLGGEGPLPTGTTWPSRVPGAEGGGVGPCGPKPQGRGKSPLPFSNPISHFI